MKIIHYSFYLENYDKVFSFEEAKSIILKLNQLFKNKRFNGGIEFRPDLLKDDQWFLSGHRFYFNIVKTKDLKITKFKKDLKDIFKTNKIEITKHLV